MKPLELTTSDQPELLNRQQDFAISRREPFEDVFNVSRSDARW